MIVPFAAGGPTDTIARVIGERMGRSLGQSVIIENVTGAGGTIAATRVARAAPDGYTLDLATWSTHVVTPVIYQLQYDVFKDFEPVAWLTQTPLLLVSKTDIPANNLKELIAWLKADPNAVLLGSAGGTDQVAGYLLKQQTGVQIQIVPYRGLAPAMQDVLGGAHRSSVRSAVGRDAANPQRQHQGLCGHGGEARGRSARDSDGR